ncbi:uncharacterized protein [Watersipora subatra]|uniref:uncharacterized protein n=1 Tax=Watersipora subatra TaxID=2589382 RepID=UPI00355C41D1
MSVSYTKHNLPTSQNCLPKTRSERAVGNPNRRWQHSKSKQYGTAVNHTNVKTHPLSSVQLESGQNVSNVLYIEEGKENLRPQTGMSRHHKKHKRTASLTDLRPEDKKKVANLIQELANLGSEKDKIEQCLKKERYDFEEAIKDLVKDQKNLLSERQAVQTELNSCQQLLSQLQEAVLHRPTSALSSLRSLKDNDGSIMLDNRLAEQSHGSELDNYISKHQTTQDMEVASEVASVTSESARNPRTSSTFIGEGVQQKRVRDNLHAADALSEISVRTNSTIDYSRKDEIFMERARLIEEQRLLKLRLAEQEELLKITQKRLSLREHEFTEQRYQDVSRPAASHVVHRGHNSESSRSFSKQTMATPVAVPVSLSRSFNVGVQVDDCKHTTPKRRTQDHSVQTEFPLQQRVPGPMDQSPGTQPPEERLYIGKRLVPSPSSCSSRSQSSMQDTIDKTNRLLESARKVIRDAKSPRVDSPISQASQSHSSRCSHSYSIHTPRKASQQLFDSDRSLASEINSTAVEAGEADRTELEMLEDIFYVKAQSTT